MGATNSLILGKLLIDRHIPEGYTGNIKEISMKLQINIQYDFEYKGFVAECPALPGCVSQGKTRTEAMKNIREAIQGYVKVLKKHHQTAPLNALQTNYINVNV